MNPGAKPAPPIAIILAAGLGSRLQSVHAGEPKGFVRIGGEPLIARSVRLLRAAGVRDLVFVIGWQGEHYRRWCASECPGARCVENAHYATTGSLESLRLGLAAIPDRDVLIVESDLLYESRAPGLLTESESRDLILVSGFTRSGDEVWVCADDRGCLSRMGKRLRPGETALGELVGLTRLSLASRQAFLSAAAALPASAHYEDGLNALARRQPVGLLHVPDLVWCEIDDPAHLARAEKEVWPRLAPNASLSHRKP